MKKIIVVLLALVLFVSATSLKAQKKELYLQDCIENALENSIALAESAVNRSISGIRLLESYLSFLPRITTNASFGIGTESRLQEFNQGEKLIFTPNDKDYQRLDFRINASLTLFNGLKNIANIQVANLEDEIAEYTFQRGKQDIAFDITRKFYQVLLDEQVVTINKKNLYVLEERLKLTEAEIEAGLKRELDLTQQKSEVFNARLQVIESENSRKTNITLLLQASRLDLNLDYSLIVPVEDNQDLLEDRFDNLSYLEELAFQRRADWLASELTIKQREWSEMSVRSTYFPSLFLQGVLGTLGNYTTRLNAFEQNQTSVTNQPLILDQLRSQWSYSIGIQLSWDLTSLLTTPFLVQSAGIETERVRLKKERLLETIRSQLVVALGDYESSKVRKQVASQSMEASKLALEFVRQQYDVKVVSWIDLQNAQRSYVKAQVDNAQARLTYILKKKNLLFVVGETLYPYINQ